MKNIFATILLCFILFHSFAQKKITATYLNAQYNKTLYDPTKGNNPWGLGLGVQTFFNNASKFKPTVELTADVYLEDDKVLRLYPDGTAMNDIRNMLNLFAGVSYYTPNNLSVSLIGGSSFINQHTYFGIKPAFGFPITKSQKWIGKIAYTNIFNRDKYTKEDFGSISIAIGRKLYY